MFKYGSINHPLTLFGLSDSPLIKYYPYKIMFERIEID